MPPWLSNALYALFLIHCYAVMAVKYMILSVSEPPKVQALPSNSWSQGFSPNYSWSWKHLISSTIVPKGISPLAKAKQNKSQKPIVGEYVHLCYAVII